MARGTAPLGCGQCKADFFGELGLLGDSAELTQVTAVGSGALEAHVNNAGSKTTTTKTLLCEKVSFTCDFAMHSFPYPISRENGLPGQEGRTSVRFMAEGGRGEWPYKVHIMWDTKDEKFGMLVSDRVSIIGTAQLWRQSIGKAQETCLFVRHYSSVKHMAGYTQVKIT